MGSHTFLDSHEAFGQHELTECQFTQADVPAPNCSTDKTKRVPKSNGTSDEFMHHGGLLNELNLPLTAVIFETDTFVLSTTAPLFRALSPPFHPPKQA